MVQFRPDAELQRAPLPHWIAAFGGVTCMLLSLFAPLRRIRSPEAEALAEALSWTPWFFLAAFLAWGLVWLILRSGRRSKKDVSLTAVERVTTPPLADQSNAEHNWLSVITYAIAFSNILVMQGPETLETLIAAERTRAIVAGGAWLGLLLCTGVMIADAVRRALRTHRASTA